MKAHSIRGQAAVETAIVSTLVMFMIFGLIQLSLIQHARAMTQYAVFNAVRSGVVNYGDCQRMSHAAVAALLPAIQPFTASGVIADNMANVFGDRYTPPYTFHYIAADQQGPTDAIIWLRRPQPVAATVPTPQNGDFDDTEPTAVRFRLEGDLTFWFPLKIPFANWLIARIFMAHWGLMAFTEQNPIVNNSQLTDFGDHATSPPFDASVATELASRIGAGHYVIPLSANYSMRMMTPVKKINFATQNCPPSP